jgi:hypothetical protein
MVSTSEPISNVVISMTANQSTPRPRALQAVRRAARALKPVNDQQVLMWEAFWRGGRGPAGRPLTGRRWAWRICALTSAGAMTCPCSSSRQAPAVKIRSGWWALAA